MSEAISWQRRIQCHSRICYLPSYRAASCPRELPENILAAVSVVLHRWIVIVFNQKAVSQNPPKTQALDFSGLFKLTMPGCQAHEAYSKIGTIELRNNISFRLTDSAKGMLRLKEFIFLVHFATW